MCEVSKACYAMVESIKFVSQVFYALQIVKNVCNASYDVLMNYNQIKCIANQMNSIDKWLKKHLKEFVEDEFSFGNNNNKDYFSLSELPRILRKIEALSLT